MTLIGNPTRCSTGRTLIGRYHSWFYRESQACFVERYGWQHLYGDAYDRIQEQIRAGTAPEWRMEERPNVERYLAAAPSSHAAVVLSAVGDWSPPQG